MDSIAASSRTSSGVAGRQGLLTGAYVAFLLVTFVGFDPLADRVALDVGDTGEGDLVRQVVFLGLAAAVGLLVGKETLQRLPVMLGIAIPAALLWCLATLLWSPVPEVGFRRLVLAAVILFIVFAVTQGLGPRRTMETTGGTLGVLVLLSLLAGLLVENAVHLPSDPEPAIVGDWRGLFGHKNGAGFFSAIAVIISAFMWRIAGGWRWPLILGAGLVLLYLSGSKTSLGMLLPALAVGAAYSALAPSRTGRMLFLVTLLAGLLFAAFWVAFQLEDIVRLLNDPTAFTGRTDTWIALWSLTMERPLLGHGYESLFGVGLSSPLLNYTHLFEISIAHGHNGYLDLLASVGLIGLWLCLFAFVALPLLKLILGNLFHAKASALVISLIAFVSLHNLLETGLLKSAAGGWIVLLIAVACINSGWQEAVRPRPASG